MFDEGEVLSPLLAQVPLTVSPFVTLPTATALPYSYKSLPATLPTSSVPISESGGAADGGAARPRFIVSTSGNAVHPNDIIEQCQKLRQYMQELPRDASKTLGDWQDEINERELAEKRRVAPGWLDRSEKILQPSKSEDTAARVTGDAPVNVPRADSDAARTGDALEEENELDRAFGRMSTQ